MSKSIGLYRGFPPTENYTWSPFVNKLELYFRLAGIPYHNEQGSVVAAPRGKVPYVDIGPMEGTDEHLISDSTLVRQYLERNGYATSLNGHLSDTDALTDRGIVSLLEDKLYWLGVKEKWIDNYYLQREGVMWTIPWPLRVFVGNLAWRKNSNLLAALGLSKYTQNELTASKTDVWTKLASALGINKDRSESASVFWILGGRSATVADCVLFGFLVSVFTCKSNPESLSIVKRLPVLEDYAQRIHLEYFPEYAKWSSWKARPGQQI